MPGPDPNALWLSEADYGRIGMTFESYMWSNSSHNRQKRVTAILRRMMRRTWRCRWCWEELPIWRRADAKYCCEGCRKRAARYRRKFPIDFG